MSEDVDFAYYRLEETNAFSYDQMPANAFVLHCFTYTHNDFQWKFIPQQDGSYRLIFDYLDKCRDLKRWRNLSPEERSNGLFRKTFYSGEISLPHAVAAKLHSWFSAFLNHPESFFIEPKTDLDMLDGASYTILHRSDGQTKSLINWQDASHNELHELREFASHFRELEILMYAAAQKFLLIVHL